MGEYTVTKAAVTPGSITDKAFVRAIGTELQLARKEHCWPRSYLVTRLPSGVTALGRDLWSGGPLPEVDADDRLVGVQLRRLATRHRQKSDRNQGES